MTSFIDEHREVYGVEPICAEIPIAPSTYYAHKDCAADPDKRSDRAKQDAELTVEILRVWNENFRVYAHARSGGNSNEKASKLHAAPWNA